MIVKMRIFRDFLLDHEDFVSGMSFVSFYNDFEQSLLNLNLKFLRENIYLPSIRFLYRKSLFKIVFDQNFFICQPIFKIFATHFATNYIDAQLFQENISSTFEHKISAKNHYHTLRNTL